MYCMTVKPSISRARLIVEQESAESPKEFIRRHGFGGLVSRLSALGLEPSSNDPKETDPDVRWSKRIELQNGKNAEVLLWRDDVAFKVGIAVYSGASVHSGGLHFTGSVAVNRIHTATSLVRDMIKIFTELPVSQIAGAWRARIAKISRNELVQTTE